MIFQNGARKEHENFAQKNPNSYILFYTRYNPMPTKVKSRPDMFLYLTKFY